MSETRDDMITGARNTYCNGCEREWPREWRQVANHWAWWHVALEGIPLRHEICALPPDPAPPEKPKASRHCAKHAGMCYCEPPQEKPKVDNWKARFDAASGERDSALALAESYRKTRDSALERVADLQHQQTLVLAVNEELRGRIARLEDELRSIGACVAHRRAAPQKEETKG